MTVYKRKAQTIEDVVVISREEHIRLQDSHQELLDLEDREMRKDRLIEKLYKDFVPHCECETHCDCPVPQTDMRVLDDQFCFLMAAVTVSLMRRYQAGLPFVRADQAVIFCLICLEPIEKVSEQIGYPVDVIEALVNLDDEEN